MKKQTFFCLSLAFFCMTLLCCLALYLRASAPGNDFQAQVQKTESEADAVLETLRSSLETADTAQTSSNESEPFLIWVGDSRTVGLERAMKNEDCYIGASGEGYYWFSSEGLLLLQDAIAEYPDAPVIFNLGVNDHENLDLYLALYRKLFQDYPSVCFYFLSVNPVDEARCSAIDNTQISDFNNHMKELFGKRYIDSYSWMLQEQIETSDGIHFKADDYQALYQFVLTFEELSDSF